MVLFLCPPDKGKLKEKKEKGENRGDKTKELKVEGKYSSYFQLNISTKTRGRGGVDMCFHVFLIYVP
jgi:hypothetical protein